MAIDPRVLPEKKRKRLPPPATHFIKDELRQEQRSLNVIDTRETFLLAWPVVQAASKSFAAIAGIVFAGSLTFLGLSAGEGGFAETEYLKWSWASLAASIVMHLFVYVAAVDGFISHGRTEGHTKNAERILQEKRKTSYMRGLNEGARAHWTQGLFFRSAAYLILALILQAVGLVAGGLFMAGFVTANL